MIRIAMLSFWHVHGKDYARAAEEHPDTEIVAIWDEVPERGRAEAAKRDVPFFENLDELLAQPNVDAVVVDAPTSMHRDVMVKAARTGKHIFTEKVIAATQREAEEIVREAQHAGIKLVVSMRRLPHASTRAIKSIIDQGLLGDLTLVSVRDAHSATLPTPDNPRGFLSDSFLDPKLAQGGVLIDMCHSVYLTRYFLGRPESVSATFGYLSGRQIEDSAVVTVRAANNSMGIIQASYAVRAAPFSIEVHGTEGSLLYSEIGIGELIARRNRHIETETANSPDGKLRLFSTKNGSSDWLVQAVTDAAPDAFDQWVSHIQQGTTADENLAIGLDLSALIEAAYHSASTGQSVTLDSLEHAS
ncbi:MAG: Gfo/Idh/MocA family oxidoreductase [Chloroflexi bacterium]|nr:Gfo/Idh/MocA family oxidoreductase [Chloroflexota bacterium]MCC6895050.1 Gfo/Idh/MocA family oxidoreductase [Anaerolineae bacterium]